MAGMFDVGIIDGFFVSSWGEIRLLASQVHTDNGRTQVVHELSSGDTHPVQDRGLRTRRVKVKLLFDDFTEVADQRELSGVAAFQAFKAAVDSGARATFVHPLGDSFEASVGDFTYEIDNSSIITADAEFIMEGERLDSPLPAAARASGASGEAAVEAAAARVDAELAKVRALKVSGGRLDALRAVVAGARSAVRGVQGFAQGIAFTAGQAVSGVGRELSGVAEFDVPVDLTADLAASITASLKATVSASLATSAGVDASATAAGMSASAEAYAYAGAGAAVAAVAQADARAGNFAAVTIDARVAVASWSLSEEPPTRQILIDVARISDNLSTVIEVGGFEHDLRLWPAFCAVILLGESVRSAAIAVTSQTPSVFMMRILASTALLPLAARIYGGELAQDRARQIANLNDISTRGWLPPGDYVMPARSPAQRSPF